MVKFTREFSDAMGFRLLSHFNNFLQEYDEIGFKVTKLYEKSFERLCFECYPLIISTGVNPSKYEGRLSPKISIRQRLMAKYPLKEDEGPKKKINEEMIDDDEDEETFYEKNCSFCHQAHLELKMRDEQISKLETENQNLKLEVEKWKTSSMQAQLKNKQLQEEIEQLRKHIDLSPDKKRRMTTGNFYQPK